MSVFYRGSEDEILETLRGLRSREWHGDETNHRLAQAFDEIKDGERFLIAASWRFEVVEPVLNVEQDVYGCESGRQCSDVAPDLRPGFEAMIAERHQALADEPRDDRSFHWFQRVAGQECQPASVRAFVDRTLGWNLVGAVADAMAEAILQAEQTIGELDVHLTMLPDRVRLRLDSDFGQRPEWPPPTGDSLASVARQASACWSVAEDRSWTLFAEFARQPGDSDKLLPNYRVVPADQIGFGAYIYVPQRHAWMQFRNRCIWHDRVEFHPDDDFTSSLFHPVAEDVAVFWDGIER